MTNNKMTFCLIKCHTSENNNPLNVSEMSAFIWALPICASTEAGIKLSEINSK